MKKTVMELIAMYENGLPNGYKNPLCNESGKLYTDHSTQREFIYNMIGATDDEANKTTKAGYLIQSILEKNIKLDAICFWSLQDDKENIHYAENEFNLHDGKQRFMSIYSFVKGLGTTTIFNGCEKEFRDLPDADKQRLLEYEIDVYVKTGTKREEEQDFYLSNSTAERLTTYENMRGSYYGPFLTEFENFIAYNYKNTFINTEVVKNRGVQAIWFLYLYFDVDGCCLIDEDKDSIRDSNLRKCLSMIRKDDFDMNYHEFKKKLDFVNTLSVVFDKAASKDKTRLFCQIANYAIKNNIDTNDVVAYYRKGFENKPDNDITRWKFKEEHKIALNRLKNNIYCDYRRFFSNDEKIKLYETTKVCGMCNNRFRSINDVRVDHVIAWSNGGRTELSNARLLCCSCNSSKGND